MGKTKDLRQAVKTIIESACNVPVYYGQTQNDSISDYVVYTVDEVTRSDGRIVYETEVNVIGYGTNTGNVEDAADDIQKAFDTHVVINDRIVVYFYAEAKNSVNEDDRKIIRRRLTFATYLYERT